MDRNVDIHFDRGEPRNHHLDGGDKVRISADQYDSFAKPPIYVIKHMKGDIDVGSLFFLSLKETSISLMARTA